MEEEHNYTRKRWGLSESDVELQKDADGICDETGHLERQCLQKRKLQEGLPKWS